jgi:hypothetical protein
MHQVWKRSSGEGAERKGRLCSIGVFENRQFGDDNASYNHEPDLSLRTKRDDYIERRQQFGIFTKNVEQFGSMVF